MRSDKLTVKSQEAIARAQSIARQRQHQGIGPAHLLAALLEQKEGVVAVLEKLGAAPEAVAREVAAALDKTRGLRAGTRAVSHHTCGERAGRCVI